VFCLFSFAGILDLTVVIEIKTSCKDILMKRFALISLLTASLLSGCGFHLRGSIVLPDSIRTVAIT